MGVSQVNELGSHFGNPVVIRGAPLEPALGLPRAVVYELRWVQWLQLVLGVGVFAFGAWAVFAAAQGTPIETKYGPVIYICLPAGPAIVWDAWRNLRRWTCLVVAENGFDDRTAAHACGPVLWQEVASMSGGTVWHVGAGHAARLHSYTVQLKPGRRQPLSPMGPVPNQVESVTLELTLREKRRVPELMEAAYRDWQDRQALYAGF
jgi:hypothetical protein